MAYRYGPTVYRSANKIAKWAAGRYRKRYTMRKGRGYLRGAKRMRFSPKSFGEQVGTSLTKQRIMNNQNTTNQNTRTLYALNLTAIPKGQGRNQRERTLVNYRGAKCCISMRNNANTPMYMNWAVVHPKVDESTPPSTTNFFRSNGNERGQDFDNTLSSQQFHCLKINTDKFTILKHKRFRLGPANNISDYGTQTGNSFKNIEWYIKIKRQLRYETDASTLPVTGNVYLLHWADRMFDDSGQVPRGGEISVQEYCVGFFRDAKN